MANKVTSMQILRMIDHTDAGPENFRAENIQAAQYLP